MATLAARVAAEMLGSLMTYCLAVGGVANALLPRTKGEGMGLLAIALAAGMGIGLPIAMFYRVRTCGGLNSIGLPSKYPRSREQGMPCAFGLICSGCRRCRCRRRRRRRRRHP